jgi:hypothetical protein
MNGTVTAVIVIAAVVVVALVLIVGIQQARRRRLRERFGPEYERRIEDHGDRRAAERELAQLARQRDSLDIRPLAPEARDRYVAAWNQVQSQFVDQPREALESANVLVSQVMQDRGYPVEDFDRRADLIAADHPNVVSHYRGAHAVQLRDQVDVTTEDQRLAFVHYRDLFAELLDTGDRDARDRDAGARNTGHRNTGDRSAGDLDAGARNAGDRNEQQQHADRGERR